MPRRLFPLAAALLLAFAPAARADEAYDALKKIYAAVDKLPQKVYGAALNAKAVLDADETWTPENLYLVFGTFSTGKHSLTIAAGTVVVFADDQIRVQSPPHGELNVDSGGALRILGTDAKRVVLASMANDELFWNGISAGFGYAEIKLQHVDVYKAGAGGGVGAIMTQHSDKEPALVLEDVHFHKLQNKGLKIWNETGITADSHVTIHSYWEKTTDPQYQYAVLDVDPIAAGTLTAKNMTVDKEIPAHARVVFVSTPMVNRSVTWREYGVPYRVIEVQVPGDTYTGPPVTLTLEPGLTVQIGDIVYIGGKTGTGQQDMGNLVAVGTKDKPIRFTSSADAPNPGDWQSLFFRGGSFDPKVTKLDWCILEFGGSLPKNTLWHQADKRGDMGSLVAVMNPPTSEPYDGPTITNTVFRKSGGQGVRGRTQGGYWLNQTYTDAKLGNTFEDAAKAQLPQKGE